jgi:hypothetical protein
VYVAQLYMFVAWLHLKVAAVALMLGPSAWGCLLQALDCGEQCSSANILTVDNGGYGAVRLYAQSNSRPASAPQEGDTYSTQD